MYQTQLDASTRVQTSVPRLTAVMQLPPADRAGLGRAPSRVGLTGATRVTAAPLPPPPPVGLTSGEVKLPLIDLSTSMTDAIERFLGLISRKTKLDAVQDGLERAIHAAVAENDDSRMCIVGYSDNAFVLCELTPVRTGIQALLGAAASLGVQGGTNIGSGLTMARQVADAAGSGRRKRIILFSDGWDTRDSSPVAVANDIKADGIFIETIGFGKTPGDVDQNTLRAIASTVNGLPQYRFFTDPVQLAAHIGKTGMTRLDY